MKRKIYRINSGPGLPDEYVFESDYVLLAKKKYSLFPSSNNPVLLGNKKPRKCCFCNRDDSQTKFTQEIDALPASMGNKIYYSYEECDECNQKFGKSCENELAQMLAPDKAVFSIPTRKKIAKHKKENGKSFIGGSEYINSLSVTLSEGDDSIKTVLDKENKKVLIEGGNIKITLGGLVIRDALI